MANPFEVRVLNLSEALDQGEAGYKSITDILKQRDIKSARGAAQEALQTGGDTRSAISRLIGAGDLQGAQVLSTMGKADTTDEIKEYNLSKSQGFTGSFTDWKTGLKRAGATNVNVNNGEKAYDKTLNEEQAKIFIGLQKAGANASRSIPTLDIMEKLVEDPGFYSGPLSESLVLPLKRGAAALGVDPNGVASMENFRALSNKSIVDSLGSLGAGVSNADVSFITGTAANLGNTPQGNKQLIGIHRKVEQRKQEVAKLAREYARKNGGRIDTGFDEVASQYAERNPLFQRPQQGGPNRTGTGVPWRVVQ